MAKVLMIVAPEKFRDEELFETRSALEAGGHTVVIASLSPGLCTGTKGGMVHADTSIDSVDARTMDAVVFVGGPGARTFFASSAAHKIAREAVHAHRIVGAICIAPVILANAGVLAHRRVTVFPTEFDAVERMGARLQHASLVVDDKIITASGPEVARAFGMAIVRALTHEAHAMRTAS